MTGGQVFVFAALLGLLAGWLLEALIALVRRRR